MLNSKIKGIAINTLIDIIVVFSIVGIMLLMTVVLFVVIAVCVIAYNIPLETIIAINRASFMEHLNYIAAIAVVLFILLYLAVKFSGMMEIKTRD